MVLGALPGVGEIGILALKSISSEGPPSFSSAIDNQKVSSLGRSTAAAGGPWKYTEKSGSVLAPPFI